MIKLKPLMATMALIVLAGALSIIALQIPKTTFSVIVGVFTIYAIRGIYKIFEEHYNKK
jgi:L-asparagine transporter-like permease